jgi:hypothetical protein
MRMQQKDKLLLHKSTFVFPNRNLFCCRVFGRHDLPRNYYGPMSWHIWLNSLPQLILLHPLCWWMTRGCVHQFSEGTHPAEMFFYQLINSAVINLQ